MVRGLALISQAQNGFHKKPESKQERALLHTTKQKEANQFYVKNKQAKLFCTLEENKKNTTPCQAGEHQETNLFFCKDSDNAALHLETSQAGEKKKQVCELCIRQEGKEKEKLGAGPRLRVTSEFISVALAFEPAACNEPSPRNTKLEWQLCCHSLPFPAFTRNTHLSTSPKAVSNPGSMESYPNVLSIIALRKHRGVRRKKPTQQEKLRRGSSIPGGKSSQQELC